MAERGEIEVGDEVVVTQTTSGSYAGTEGTVSAVHQEGGVVEIEGNGHSPVAYVEKK